MTSREKARLRTAMLKGLREEHASSVARTQALLKDQKAIRKELCRHMRDNPKTVPELAELTDMPTSQVLWHVTAMKKYDLVVEGEMCGEYYQYQMAKDKRK